MEGGCGQSRARPHVAGTAKYVDGRLMEGVRLAMAGVMREFLVTPECRVGHVTLEPDPLHAVLGEG